MEQSPPTLEDEEQMNREEEEDESEDYDEKSEESQNLKQKSNGNSGDGEPILEASDDSEKKLEQCHKIMFEDCT